MKKVIFDYGRASTPSIIGIAREVYTGFKDNDYFPQPIVPLTDLSKQIDRVTDAAVAASHGDRLHLATLRNEKKKLADMLRSLGGYVNMISKGDETIMLSSGFALTKDPQRKKLPIIAKINAGYTNLPNTIDLTWSMSKHARYYKVFISADNGQTFTELSTVLSRKLMVEGLVSGKRYQFKVLPVGVAGQGEVSDIASQIAA